MIIQFRWRTDRTIEMSKIRATANIYTHTQQMGEKEQYTSSYIHIYLYNLWPFKCLDLA